jgi:hypothetical protein
MEKKPFGQGMNPWDTEAANDTFFFEEYELFKDMEICRLGGFYHDGGVKVFLRQ